MQATAANTINPDSGTSSEGAGGQVIFNGSITDSSCNVDSSSNGQKVDLGKWASNYFTGTGFETTKTPFHIKVKDCPASVTTVAVLFDGARDQSDNSLLAINGGASGVAIKLYEHDRSTAVSSVKRQPNRRSLRVPAAAPALPTSSFTPTISPPRRP
ncbi:Type-1 fimbrial protein, A chain precursor [Klebsiella pneumoniae]|nr:Type-1 fimbrial protein, A chain precursor [Klebsiella pneumoniae]